MQVQCFVIIHVQYCIYFTLCIFFLHPERMQYDIRHLRIHISIMIFISKFHFDVTPSTLFVDRAQKTIDGLDLKWQIYTLGPYITLLLVLGKTHVLKDVSSSMCF